MNISESLTLAGSLVLSLGGGAGIVFLLSSWLGKVWASRLLAQDREKFREETEKVLESVRGEREKGVFVHKVQFETEFLAYRAIWKSLSDVASSALRLRPVVDHMPVDKTREEIKRERLQEFGRYFNQFLEIVREYKPFVDSALDQPLQEMMRSVREESIDYEHSSESNAGIKGYWNKQKENTENIQRQADEVCSLIRERIGILVVIEDQAR